MSEYTFKAGDTKPLRVTLQRADRSAIPLAGATVTFEMDGAVAGLPTVIGAATILEGTVNPDSLTGALFPRGMVEYRWVAGQTDVRGLYRAVWRILDAAGDLETVPNEGYFSVIIE